MKYVRFKHNDETSYGILKYDKIHRISNTPYDDSISITDNIYSLDEVKLLSPTSFSKAVCIGLNYRDHAIEFGLPIPELPVVFIKPSTTENSTDSIIKFPEQSKRLDYEAELAVVIKKECHYVEESDALDYVLGYTIANDVTARDLQPKNGQWTIAKSFDTFLPLGPYISDEIDPSDLYITSRVNGVTKQESRTSNLIFKIPFLISYISKVMTLLPGDVISTGTPGGISGMQKGDIVEIEIEGLSILKNTIG